MKKRLSKALAAAGVASRRKCELLIQEGRVTVNGEVILLPEEHVTPETDRISVDGKPISSEEKKVYFVLNKPAGYICSHTAKGKKVIDLFTHMPHRLFTVGRLDKETTGLLLVTNDGHFANRVIHPSFGVTKEYLAKTGSEISANHLAALSTGQLVEGTFVKPLSVKKVRRGTVKIVVAEGKKREVRALLEGAGLTVWSLSRIRIGALTLGSLPLGSFRELTTKEREALTT